jgi:DNA-binding PucR family transcriptional regulator
MLHRAGDYVQSALPPWIADLFAADTKPRGALVQTLRSFADADMNVLEAARALGLHPNTIYARMQRINAITGRDCRRYHDLTELLLAADCQRI